MSTHVSNNLLIAVGAVVVAAVASLFVVYYRQDLPDDAILSATTVEAPVELEDNRNELIHHGADEGLYLTRDNGEIVKIQIQGGSVGSFPPTHRPSAPPAQE